MDTELLEFEKTDEGGRLWVVPNRVASISPCLEYPDTHACLTLAGGHRFTVVGSADDLAKKLRERTGRELGMHPPIYLTLREPLSVNDAEFESAPVQSSDGTKLRHPR